MNTTRSRKPSAKSTTKLSRFHQSPPVPKKRSEKPIYFDHVASTPNVPVCTTESWTGATGPDGQLVIHEMRINIESGLTTCTCNHYQYEMTRRARAANLMPTVETPDLHCKHLRKAIPTLQAWGYLPASEPQWPEPPLGSLDNPSDDQLDAMDDLSDAEPEPETEGPEPHALNPEPAEGDIITVITPFFFPRGTRISRREEQRVRDERHAELVKEAGRDYTIGCEAP